MKDDLLKQILNEMVEYLKPVIKEAGNMVLCEWKKIEIVKQKDARDIATKTDIGVENFIKEKILSKWPNHGFWVEEGERINPKSDYQWLVDSIDGTKFYIA